MVEEPKHMTGKPDEVPNNGEKDDKEKEANKDDTAKGQGE